MMKCLLRSRWRLLGSVAPLALLLLAACSILPSAAPVQRWLPPQASDTVVAAGAGLTLRVDTPHASGLLDAHAIVVWPAPGEVSTYHAASWSELPAVVMRKRLVDAFMASKLRAVTTDVELLASDYVLGGELRAFQTEYRAGHPTVVVRLDAHLRRAGSQGLLATRSFVVNVVPTGPAVAQIVTAFGVADDRLAAQVVTWTFAAVAAADTPAARQPQP